jgi:mycofactocin biosynthetic radical S-adenosylmethionine protein MftC
MECAASTEAGLEESVTHESHRDVAFRTEPFGTLAYHHGDRRLTFRRSRVGTVAPRPLAEELAQGLDAPICLTWELTYRCNLSCVHCLSSSGLADPDELSSREAMALVDELVSMQVFYVNIGGGEPTLRPDFLDLVEYAVSQRLGVKFSTNGTTMTPGRARRYAGFDYLDIQVSLDGATPETNDPVRGEGTFQAAVRAMDRLAEADFGPFKLSVVVTRRNAVELDDLLALSSRYGAQLRLTRLRPSGRAVAVWNELRPTAEQLRSVHGFLVAHPEVLTGDSFFHLSPLGGAALPGLNLCGAGRVVCLVDPVGDVYACPFVMHPDFRAGSLRQPGGFSAVWRRSDLFAGLRRPSPDGACNACGSYFLCHGGCMAAKFLTGLPLDGPDPECVLGHGEAALVGSAVPASALSHATGHTKLDRPVPVAFRTPLTPLR